MLRDYWNWLESELKLSAGATENPYTLGQAHMAKRALERLEREIHGRLVVAIETTRADEVLTALEMLEERETSLDPALAALRLEIQNARSLEGTP